MKYFPSCKALATAAILCFSFSAFSQIEFKLHWMDKEQQWGVFARLEEGATINPFNIVGSGQVTLLAPTGTSFRGMHSVSGEWVQNAFIQAPEEKPDTDYISFGLISNDPEIMLLPDQETLLFTFKPRDGNCPEFLSLINNDDPLAIYPNSANSNAGNDLSVMDPRTMKMYNFARNYMPEAWNCKPGEVIALGEYLTGKDRYKAKILKP
ncbi:MAG: hypothetical protein AAFZ15_14035 [Bacteroidota bacterium]